MENFGRSAGQYFNLILASCSLKIKKVTSSVPKKSRREALRVTIVNFCVQIPLGWIFYKSLVTFGVVASPVQDYTVTDTLAIFIILA